MYVSSFFSWFITMTVSLVPFTFTLPLPYVPNAFYPTGLHFFCICSGCEILQQPWLHIQRRSDPPSTVQTFALSHSDQMSKFLSPHIPLPLLVLCLPPSIMSHLDSSTPGQLSPHLPKDIVPDLQNGQWASTAACDCLGLPCVTL